MKLATFILCLGKFSRTSLLSLLATWLGIMAAHADQDIGDITVSANAIYTGNTFHGYSEVRVLLQNRSHGITHVVTLVSPNHSWDSGNSISRLSRTATLAPEASEVVTLLQPPLPMNGDGMIHVEVDGRDSGDINSPNARNHAASYYSGSYGSSTPPVTLISRSLDFNSTDTALGTNDNPGLTHGSHHAHLRVAGVDSVENLRAETAISDWSDNWLAYSPFDAVVLQSSDFASMPPPVFSALGDYLSAGGTIILAGQTNLPSAWHAWTRTGIANGFCYRTGMGQCYAFDATDLSTLDSASIRALRIALRDSAGYWRGLPNDTQAANNAFPIVKNLKIPTRGIVLIMLAFIIVIGPVNIVILNRRKRRTWMLWTVPAISLATTLIVFVYSLLREGITPDTRIAGLTLLDQVSHHAATVGVTAFYCPLTPANGLNFEYGTEVTPLVSTSYGSGNGRELDWTHSQHLQHGWVSARVPAHFHLRKTETRRERLQIVKENGVLKIVNSLGAPIKSLWIADKDLNFYQANNIDAGQKGELSLMHHPPNAIMSGADALWHDISFTARTDSLNAPLYLLPNTYIATLDGNPFIENALGSTASPRRTKTSAVVFGILNASDIP